MIKNMSIILSEHFRLTEFTTSLVAVTRRIDNTPPLSAVGNLQQLCLHVLEPLRAHLGHAVRINSGYRSPRLNAAVGGVKTSDHTRGCAADIFIPDAKTGREWFAWMMDNLPFDQLIWETASGGQGLLDPRRLPGRGPQPPAGDRPPRETVGKSTETIETRGGPAPLCGLYGLAS